jgi:L-aspartate oxidase
MKTVTVDALVIGSGIAGLTYALKLAKANSELQIAMVTKDHENESNTKYAQGGIAIVSDVLKDSIAKHIKDTLRAGDGLCKKDVVEMVVTSGYKRLEELISWGVSFDKDEEGQFDLGLEGGHTSNRIYHHKDITGKEIEEALIKQVKSCKNIHIYTHFLAVDLITYKKEVTDNQCIGAIILNRKTEEIIQFHAKITVLATGGIGQVYEHTTNPAIATGDGIAMAQRAGALIENMEFIQFHPTAFSSQNHLPSFLISEAVRGFGAYLLNEQGNRFLLATDPRGELASRDIVSKAIHNEIAKSKNSSVYLDCRHLDAQKFKAKFPFIHSKLKEAGYDPGTDLIPISTAAHYLCGGISVNETGQTTISHLFACGECAYTGLHGANRLASNSLLEALVYAHNAFLKSLEYVKQPLPEPEELSFTTNNNLPSVDEPVIENQRKKLIETMSEYAGIVRNDDDLQKAKARIESIKDDVESYFEQKQVTTDLIELRNLLEVGFLIVEQSINRTTNCGTFCKEDVKLEDIVA